MLAGSALTAASAALAGSVAGVVVAGVAAVDVVAVAEAAGAAVVGAALLAPTAEGMFTPGGAGFGAAVPVVAVVPAGLVAAAIWLSSAMLRLSSSVRED